MNTLKRSYSKGGSQGEGINELGKSGSSKGRSYSDAQMSETDNCSNIPFIKQVDNAKLLPRYTAVLSRPADVGVGMEDLDQLQQDLEKLLSTCAVRNRLLRSEIESGDKAEERREDKSKPPLKRRKPDDRNKNRESRNSVRKLKAKHYGASVSNSTSSLPAIVEVPEIPRNDTSDKFWLSIEPFCADVSKDDIAFLDELIQECSQEVQVKIPEVGDHYAAQWSEEILAEEQNLGSGGKSGKSKSIDLKKNGLNAMVNLFANPSTLSALVEEKAPDLGLPKGSSVPHANICMELVEQGILGIKDLPKNLPPEDEILLEIKKCQQELATVNEHNVKELNKLRSIVATDQKRQEVKEALDKVDKQVMEMYNKILLAKQKPANKDKQDEDSVLPKQKPYIEINEVENIIKQQMKLHAVLNEQTVYSILH